MDFDRVIIDIDVHISSYLQFYTCVTMDIHVNFSIVHISSCLEQDVGAQTEGMQILVNE